MMADSGPCKLTRGNMAISVKRKKTDMCPAVKLTNLAEIELNEAKFQSSGVQGNSIFSVTYQRSCKLSMTNKELL